MTQVRTPDRPPPRPLAGQLTQRFKALREARGWSAQDLADACADAGYSHLTRDVIASMDAGRRRDVTVDELAVLTHVLDGRGDYDQPRTATAALLLADAGLQAARRGGPAWLADPGEWLMFSNEAYERETRLMELITRFSEEAGIILGFTSDPEVTWRPPPRGPFQNLKWVAVDVQPDEPATEPEHEDREDS